MYSEPNNILKRVALLSFGLSILFLGNINRLLVTFNVFTLLTISHVL